TAPTPAKSTGSPISSPDRQGPGSPSLRPRTHEVNPARSAVLLGAGPAASASATRPLRARTAPPDTVARAATAATAAEPHSSTVNPAPSRITPPAKEPSAILPVKAPTYRPVTASRRSGA